MAGRTSAPFGVWQSPIESQMVARAGRSARGVLSELQVDRGRVYWRQLQADQAGRFSIFRLDDEGTPIDLLPQEASVSTRVHEYGGGSYTVDSDVLYYVNSSDQRIYKLPPGGIPRPITPEPGSRWAVRYADLHVSPDGQSLVCVRERHLADGQVINELATFDAARESSGRTLARGHDFYSNPRWSQDGQFLSWLTWDQPNMPWDGTELWVAQAGPEGLSAPNRIAGGYDISIFQPFWGPDGTLYYVSDRSGWWNLCRVEGGSELPIHARSAEYGSPQWVFGLSRYALLSDSRIAAIATSDGVDQLFLIDTGADLEDRLDLPFTAFNPSSLRSDGEDLLWFIASSPSVGQALYTYDTRREVLSKLVGPMGPQVDPNYISIPQAITCPSGDGDMVHAIYYPPMNPGYENPGDELPPLIVSVHGGPTSAAKMQYHLETQYFTSRGFAVADVNYRGSTGYGRRYREALKSNWGLFDREDCRAVAHYLADAGMVDARRMAIRGSSAGGFTTLCALIGRSDFCGGTSYFGLSDLSALAEDDHKFEQRYLDGLIGPYPEQSEKYRERSPLHHSKEISAPLLLLHGSEDPVVPPGQAVEMAEALESNGVPVSLITLDGESHGFNKEESVVRALEAELSFYLRIMQINPSASEQGQVAPEGS